MKGAKLAAAAFVLAMTSTAMSAPAPLPDHAAGATGGNEPTAYGFDALYMSSLSRTDTDDDARNRFGDLSQPASAQKKNETSPNPSPGLPLLGSGLGLIGLLGAARRNRD